MLEFNLGADNLQRKWACFSGHSPFAVYSLLFDSLHLFRLDLVFPFPRKSTYQSLYLFRVSLALYHGY